MCVVYGLAKKCQQCFNCCSRIGFGFGSSSVGLFGLLAACLIYQRTKLLHMLYALYREMWNVSQKLQQGEGSIWGARTLHGQLWLCPRFNALMLPEFYSQRRAEQGKRNAVSVSWPFLAKKLLTIKIKKFSIYAACKSKNNYNCIPRAIIKFYVCVCVSACECVCVCVEVHKSCTVDTARGRQSRLGR